MPIPASIPRCPGTSKRTGLPCKLVMGHGTDHPGVGKCKFHGGMTPVKHGRYSMVKRESLRELADAMEADADPLNILPELAQARALYVDFINRYDAFAESLINWNLSWRAVARPVNGHLRAGFEYVIDELEALLEEPTDEQREAIANARTYVTAVGMPIDGKPTQLMDIADARGLLGEVTKTVERIEKIRAANAISRPDLMRLTHEMGRIVHHHLVKLLPGLTDEQQSQLEGAAAAISDEWMKLRV